MKRLLILIMATFIVGCSIAIGQATFDRVNYVEVRSTWKELGDTCTIRLPFAHGKIVPDSTNNESILYTKKNGETVQLKQGDFVTVDMSYTHNGKKRTFNEFVGFVKRIKPGRPVELECEDYLYLFRKTNLTKSYKNLNVSEVVKDIVAKVNAKYSSNYPVKLVGNQDIKVDSFRIDNANAATALQAIKERCMLTAWFRNDELYVGLPYLPVNATPVKFALSGPLTNIHDNSLVFVKSEDRPFRVKYVGLGKDNKEVVVYSPKEDNGGEQVTIRRTDVSDVTMLQHLADTIHKQKQFDGYEGTIGSFLIPQVKHSWSVELQDEEYALHNGRYMVDEVVTTLDGGIKRTITIGKKLA